MSVPPGTEMFQFPGFAPPAYRFSRQYPKGVGCPIRTSTDQSLLAAPHGFSQRATSFIASWCQGIHRMPFLHSKSTPTLHRNHRSAPGARRQAPGVRSRAAGEFFPPQDTHRPRNTHTRDGARPSQPHATPTPLNAGIVHARRRSQKTPISKKTKRRSEAAITRPNDPPSRGLVARPRPEHPRKAGPPKRHAQGRTRT